MELEIRYISRKRAEHLMGALGLMGGTLISGVGVERWFVLQPAESDIADGPLLNRSEAINIMDRAERYFGDCGADMAAINSARQRLTS